MELTSLIPIHSTHKLLTIYIIFAICVEYEVSKALASLLEALFGTNNGQNKLLYRQAWNNNSLLILSIV